jgi:predicted 3-demethylubiquinone-9 3-methyltransferase (glyoxalase superfamily)
MELIGSGDAEGAGRAMQAMMGMKKLDIQKLLEAHQG